MEYPKIDFIYWRNLYEKTINGNKPNKRVEKSLNSIKTIILKDYQKNGNSKLSLLLKKEKLEDRVMSKIKQLADEIADDIHNKPESNDIEIKYLTIFDAINAWGGVSAKGMYNPKDKNKPSITTRKSWKLWIEKYIDAVRCIKMGETTKALEKLHKVDASANKIGIENLGIAFATKHMWYWSDYYLNLWEKGEIKKPNDSKLNERYIVFDMRISKLLFYKKPERISYIEALKKFEFIKKNLKKELQNINVYRFDNSDIEKALFAFSQFYFANDIDVWDSIGGYKYKRYPGHYSKEKYIEITKIRIEQCKDQKAKLSNGKDFKIASEIFSKTAPLMDKWMKGGEIIPKEKLESKTIIKDKKKYKQYQKTSSLTTIFRLITSDKIHYTYRKNVSTIEELKKKMLYALNKNDNWPKKWFDSKNKIEIMKTFENIEDAIEYQNNLKN
jgi:hypothetical protein